MSYRVSGLLERIWRELLTPPALVTPAKKQKTEKESSKKKVYVPVMESERHSLADNVKPRRTERIKIFESDDGYGSYSLHEEPASQQAKTTKIRDISSARKRTSGGAVSDTPKTKKSSKNKHVPKYAAAKQSVRGILERHGFDPSILDEFSMAFLQAEAYGSVMRLQGTRHAIALKRSDLPAERVGFIDQAMTHLEEQHFNRFSALVPMKGGKKWVSQKGDVYYATEWISGQTADFTSINQLGKASKTLSLFHKASLAFEPEGYVPKTAFDIKERLMQRTDQLESYLKLVDAKKEPSEVDEYYYDHAPDFIRQADKAIRLLDVSKCSQRLEEEEENPSLCHLDLTANNIIYTPNLEMVLIDFDYMSFGPRTLDLAHLIRRSMQAKNWSPDIALVAISNYNTVNTLTHAEYIILQAFLTFPHRFWRTAHGYYERGKSSKRLREFERCVKEEPLRQRFLQSFERQIMRNPWK